MKTVIISRNAKELVRVPLNRKSILAGRSPSCDAVVRYKGVKPVQFLIEHVSENGGEASQNIDFESGFWTLIDVSENDLHQAGNNDGGGAGIVIDETQQNFNGFDFKIVTDSLQETDLKKGVLSRSIDHSAGSGDLDRSVVEVVYFRKDIDIVTNISHLNRKKTAKKIKLFPQQLPDFIFEWENSADIKASIRSENPIGKAEIFRRGERITADFVNSKTISIRGDDMIHIETPTDDFYLRLVPEINVALEKFSWSKDYMVRTLIAVLAIISMLVFIVRNFTPPIIEKIAPPRLIQIETTPRPEPVVEKPEPQIPQEPAPEPEAKVVETKPVPEPKKPTKPDPVVKEKPKEKPSSSVALSNAPKKQDTQASATAVVQKPNNKPKVGLNNNSAPKNVNTIGLLAKLKNGQKSTTQKVSADQVLNQGVVSETMTGETGTVVVNKAPQGTLGRSKEPPNKNALAEASTTLSGAKTSDPNASGAMAMANGKSRFSSGSKLNGLQGNGSGGAGSAGSNGSNGTGTTGSGFDRGEAMQAVGGLDKDAIRKALRENRRAIANCYETALLTKKQLDGRMTFRWVISIEGSVSSIKLQSSEVGMPNFEACVETVIKGIRFPQAPNKMTTTVIYPFAFQGKK